MSCPSVAITKAKLAGVLVVIDPGHGGLDDGASGVVNGNRVVEDEHVYDTALRVRDMIVRDGGKVVLTIVDPRQSRPINNPAGKWLTDGNDEQINGRGCKPLKGGSSCLRSRLDVAKRAIKDHRGKVVWISIHFDVVGNDKVTGVRIITPEGRTPQVAEDIRYMFAKAKRCRAHGPIAFSGDKRYGLRRLYVLGSRNPIRDRILIELGNFKAPEDLWRIRDPKVRDGYAACIVNGLIKWSARS
ncbi:MAG: N-acetylmuramoyl-L-alanine amidase [bacterium]|nr:N-acetylmuramoyl-L-alanine amidase [bacterium]